MSAEQPYLRWIAFLDYRAPVHMPDFIKLAWAGIFNSGFPQPWQ
jgi:hypothetical protein